MKARKRSLVVFLPCIAWERATFGLIRARRASVALQSPRRFDVTPISVFTLPPHGRFALTDDNVLLMCLPRPLNTVIATMAIRARISEYSTRLWAFRDRSALYSF